MNESSPEGWLFYQQAGGSGTVPPLYQVTAVQQCTYSEGFTGGQIQAGPYVPYGTGMAAITADMSNDASVTGKCLKNPHR